MWGFYEIKVILSRSVSVDNCSFLEIFPFELNFSMSFMNPYNFPLKSQGDYLTDFSGIKIN